MRIQGAYKLARDPCEQNVNPRDWCSVVIAGAGLDTQEVEPPPEDSDIWQLENVFLTPHIGWRRLETRQRLVDKTADNIESYVKGDLQNVVN